MGKSTCPHCGHTSRNFSGFVFIKLADNEYYRFSKLWLHLIECHGIKPDPRIAQALELQPDKVICKEVRPYSHYFEIVPEPKLPDSEYILPKAQLLKLKRIISISDTK